MPQKSSKIASRNKTDEIVRRALESIIQSSAFRQVDRLQRFLRYIVEETLQGRGEQLKEYPVGVDVFGRDASFDPRIDPIVRVQARRLRARLAQYYAEEGRNDPMMIELPKGGYAPKFRSVPLTLQPKKMISTALMNRNSVVVLPFEDDTN